jgi:hypothetical protein
LAFLPEDVHDTKNYLHFVLLLELEFSFCGSNDVCKFCKIRFHSVPRRRQGSLASIDLYPGQELNSLAS